MAFDNISKWLIYINLFFKNTIKNARFHIHLIHRPLILCCNGKYSSDGIHPCYRSKGFIIIYTIFLCISFGNQPCLMLFKFSFFIQFGLIDPYDSNTGFVCRDINKIPSFSIASISSFMAFTHYESFTASLKDAG